MILLFTSRPPGTAQLQPQMSVLRMHRRNGDVDEIQSTSTQHSQARGHLVIVESMTRTDTTERNEIRQWPGHAITVGVRLSIYIDSDASVKTHISRTVSNCFAIPVLRQIHSIRRSISQQVLQSLVLSLVLICLDCGNVTLAGIASNQLDICDECCCVARMFKTPLLHDLHWLWVLQRIEFKFAVLVFRCQHSTVCCTSSELRRVADMDSRRRLCFVSMLELDIVSPLVTTPSE